MCDVVTTPDDSPMSKSMPADAENPQTSAAVPAGPRSGRGRQLTTRQEAMLIELCEQQNVEGRYADKPKSFWRWISDTFKHETGRTYSWQSCRRRMIKLEDEARRQHPCAPSPIPSVQAEPSGVELSVAFPDPDEVIAETHHSNDGEDDDLPPVPVSVARDTNAHTRYDREYNADRLHYQHTINEAVVQLEMCLSIYGRKIIEDEDDLHNVFEAFDRFQEEYQKAVEKGKGGQEEGSR